MTEYSVPLIVLALLVLGMTAFAVFSGEHGDSRHLVYRDEDRFWYWARIGLAAAAGIVLLIVAWWPVRKILLIWGMGIALLACGLISLIQGKTVLYRDHPMVRDVSPFEFWVHVTVMIVGGLFVLAWSWEVAPSDP